MLKKIRHISIGWMKTYGWLPTSEAERKLSDLRMKACGRCRHSEESKALKLLNGNVSYEMTLYCTKCGCPCVQKTIVVAEICPLEKW